MNGKRVSTRSTRPNSDNSGIEQGWLPPLESIERIEVIRGPMSSLYGSDAMGGVINVITKKSRTPKLDRFVAWRCNLRENHDSGDIFQTNAYASGPLIDGLLGAKVTGLLSRRAEDKIVNGYNEQKMRNGGITLNFRRTRRTISTSTLLANFRTETAPRGCRKRLKPAGNNLYAKYQKRLTL